VVQVFKELRERQTRSSPSFSTVRKPVGVLRFTSAWTARSSADLPNFGVRFEIGRDLCARVQGSLSCLNDQVRITLDDLMRTELTSIWWYRAGDVGGTA
jgi:hypothetical protein